MPGMPMIWECPPDRMSPLERMQALVTPGQKPDRVPFIPLSFGFCTRNCGWSLADFYNNPERCFAAQVRTQEQYGYDGFPLYGFGSMGGWEFGGEIKWPGTGGDQAPCVARWPVNDENDVDRLKAPDDVLSAGIIPTEFALSKLQSAAGMPVTVQLGSALMLTGNLVNLSTMLRWMIRKPDLVHHMLRLMTDFLLKVAQAWAEAFPGQMLLGFDGGPTDSNYLISPEQFREFGLPYTREIHEKALAMGFTVFHTHVCGEQNANLDALREVDFGHPGGPSGMMSFGHEVDLKDAIEKLGDKAVIMGNVEPAKIQMSSAEEVFELSCRAVERGKDAPLGYALMAGCEVPPQAPGYNIFTMLKACKVAGQY